MTRIVTSCMLPKQLLPQSDYEAGEIGKYLRGVFQNAGITRWGKRRNHEKII